MSSREGHRRENRRKNFEMKTGKTEKVIESDVSGGLPANDIYKQVTLRLGEVGPLKRTDLCSQGASSSGFV